MYCVQRAMSRKINTQGDALVMTDREIKTLRLAYKKMV
jgi:hypothetical protein